MVESVPLPAWNLYLQNALTGVAIVCMIIWLLINRGRHTIGAKWFGLAAWCFAASLGVALLNGWHQGTFYVAAILFAVGALSLWVPEKGSLNGQPRRPTPWRFWLQGEWERDYNTPARPYPDGKPPVPWAIRHKRAVDRGETPPPPPWEDKRD